MTSRKEAARRSRLARKQLSLAVVAALGGAWGVEAAHAFGIDTGNSDVEIRWDNSVRYNAAWRMEKVNPHFFNHAGFDETEGAVKRGDMITNRLSLLSEFDFAYKGEYGFRVSGSAWTEHAYGDKVETNPAITGVTSHRGPSGEYSPYAERYLTGTSGEILDAFVWGNLQLGDTTLRLKAGQHNLFWGESLFTAANGIAAGMGPIDTVKAATSPGAEVKELFLPTKQVSAQWTLTDTVSVMGFYQFDWRPFRLVAGGTFFATSDAAGDPLGNDPTCAAVIANPLLGPNGLCQKSLGAITPGDDGGDFGVALRWTPIWLTGGTMGFYYRKYDEKIPWSATQVTTNPLDLGLRLSYGRDTELFGVSLTKQVGEWSVGSELSYRKDTALATKAGFFIGTNAGGAAPTPFASTAQTPSYDQVEGARGNTWHFLINGVGLLKPTALYDSGTILAELSYQHLDKVTKNANVFFGEGFSCRTGGLDSGLDETDGCSTRNAWSLNVSFTPEWAQVLPSLNLAMPTSLAYGLKGNSATLGGTYEGAYTWSLGLRATYNVVHEFTLAYTDSHADYKTKTASAVGANPGVGTVVGTSRGASSGAGIVNDHGWLSFTYKTSF